MTSPYSRSLIQNLDIDAPHITEARRILQSLARRNPERKVFLVTSASRGEGKSTVCGLLGVVSARLFRKRTLIIDGDLRRPTIHKVLGVGQRPGLVELLRGDVRSPEDPRVMRVTPLPTLFAIPSGSVRGAAGEAYDDEAFAAQLATLRRSFDLILIDSAPVVPVIEPVLMAERADGILVVAMAGRTPATLARRANQILAPVASKIAGVILNNATEGLPYYYDYRYYGYKTQPSSPPAPQPEAPDRSAASSQLPQSGVGR